MKNKKKVLKLLLLLTFAFVLLIPRSYAFYYSKYESLLNSLFNLSNVKKESKVRATVLTYWVDTNYCVDSNDYTTCDMYGRSAWNLKTELINSNWILNEDGYYYYKNTVDASTIEEANIEDLIDPTLTIYDLTDDYLLGTNVVPQYEVLYEIIENK